MAVMEMKRIGIYARKSDRKRILELLQRKGVVEVHSPQEAGEAIFENRHHRSQGHL